MKIKVIVRGITKHEHYTSISLDASGIDVYLSAIKGSLLGLEDWELGQEFYFELTPVVH